MTTHLRELFDHFNTEGSFEFAEPYGSGHIHDTFLVKTYEPEKNDFILQKLNTHVFKNIPQLQNNIERVTKHMRSKLSSIPGSDPDRECLNIVYSKGGKSWIIDKDLNYWRMYVFIPRHRSYNMVDSPEKAFQGGRSVGRFQALLADMGGDPLFDTIPFFQDVGNRLKVFNKTLKNDPVKRKDLVKEEIGFILKRADSMKVILKLGKEGRIPVRTTHNDTKFNNILFDEDEKALCLIDLDTVMPGYVHYDFGDAIRTAASSASEDEKDLSLVNMNIDLFRAFSEGYISEAADTLNQTEKDHLAFAPILITYTQAVRFLTDYIDGDNYYKIYHEHHNLQRTRAQIRLIESMEEQYQDMVKIIKTMA
jgi:hypothetical protein